MPLVVIDREGHILNDGEPLYGEEIVLSEPPTDYHRIVNIYAKKVGTKYHLMVVVETEPK